MESGSQPQSTLMSLAEVEGATEVDGGGYVGDTWAWRICFRFWL